jgi:hypothetical protein
MTSSAVERDWCSGVALSARRTVHIAEIMQGHRKSTFTVVTYRGKDAEKVIEPANSNFATSGMNSFRQVWRRDFVNFSRNESVHCLHMVTLSLLKGIRRGIRNVQLFGLNRSSMPSLIFYDGMCRFA